MEGELEVDPLFLVDEDEDVDDGATASFSDSG